MVLLILALVWAVALVPHYLRNRSEGRPADSIGAFRHQLSVLQRTSPEHGSQGGPYGRPDVPLRLAGTAGRPVHRASARARQVPGGGGRSGVRKRRRDILSGLLVGVGGAAVLGFVPGFGVMHGLAAVLAVLLVAYVALLVRLRDAAAERVSKVRYLPSHARPAQPTMLLRRSGS